VLHEVGEKHAALLTAAAFSVLSTCS
jgi:hypothetical protein